MTPSTKTNPSTAKPDEFVDVLEGLERLAAMQAQLIRQIQRQQQP
jgi:hypothetical protein